MSLWSFRFKALPGHENRLETVEQLCILRPVEQCWASMLWAAASRR